MGIFGDYRKNKEKYITKFKELYDQGLTDSEIARQTKTGLHCVNYWRNKNNLPKNFEYKRNFDINEFKKLYLQGFNYSEIARILNVSNSSIQDYASKNGYRPNNKYEEISLTDNEFQVFLGSIYGDASLTLYSDCKNVRGGFAHSLAQQNYCIWKYEQLKRFCVEPKINSQYDKRTKKTYYRIDVRIKANPVFTQYYDKIYKNKVKYINEELFSKIEPLGLAVWFMDDGFKIQNSFSIATNCFSDNDLKIILKVMKEKFNLHFSIFKNHVIYLATKDRMKFLNLISPYIHSDCLYKIKNSISKTPLNRVNPKMDVPVLNHQEIDEKAKRLTVMPNEKDEAIKSDTKAGHCLE